MGKTVTISVSTKYVKETVTLQELGIDENMDDKAIKKNSRRIFPRLALE